MIVPLGDRIKVESPCPTSRKATVNVPCPAGIGGVEVVTVGLQAINSSATISSNSMRRFVNMIKPAFFQKTAALPI